MSENVKIGWQSEWQRKGFDLGFFAIVLFLFFALKGGLVYVWDAFALPVPGFLVSFPFSLPALVAFVLVAVSAVWVRSIPVVRTFGQDVILELSKVVWPDRRQTVMSAGIVIVMLGIVALLLFVCDLVWGTLTKSMLEF